MAAEPEPLGTLIVVVGKARNLPNLARFGKQDPFCTISVGAEKKKTKPIKRGGQHPEWDEELRFTILQDTDDILAAAAAEAAANSLRRKPDTLPPLPTEEPGVVTPATMASKSRVAKTGKTSKKAGKTMRVACYADDPKEPELIGEVVVPIDEVLKKGEVDEWYELQSKDKYTGEIYLECTYFSNATPPVKRDVPRPAVYNPNAPVRPQAQSSTTGMNLYIPPYGKHPAAAAAATTGAAPPTPPSVVGLPPSVRPTSAASHATLAAHGAASGRLNHSSSFSELGLPQQHTSGPIAGQPEYPPGGHPGVHSAAAVDDLTRPMMSMSLGPSYRPNGPGRHESFSPPHPPGRHESFSPPQPLPPAGHPPAPMAQQPYGTISHGHRHSTDSTASGVAPWAQQQPPQPPPIQRPGSAVDHTAYGMQQDPRMNGLHSVSPVMIGHHQTGTQSHHHRTNSANLVVPGRDSAPPTAGYSAPTGYAGTPRPNEDPQTYPQHSHSASSISAASPYPPLQNQQAYSTPPRRHSSYGPQYQDTPPQPTPPQQYAHPQPYGAPPPQPAFNQAPPQQYGQPQQQQDYPPVPPPPQKQTSGVYTGPAYDPHRQRTDSFSNNPTVPGGYPSQSYPSSQTPAPPPVPPQPSPPKTSTGSAYVPWYMQTQQQNAPPQSPPATQYGTPPQVPAPPPQSRPNPPPRVGYYPSDELYAIQQNQQAAPPVPPPPSQTPYPQNPQPSPSIHNGYNAQQQQYPPESSYPPQSAYPSQSSYQQPQQPAQSPQPPAPSGYNNSSYTATPPPPPRPSADAPWSGLQRQPSYSNSPTQSHTLYYAQQDVRPGTAAPSDFRPGTTAPDWNATNRVPSPLPPGGTGATNRDWRSYLSSLSSTENPPPRAASPAVPPRPYSSNTNTQQDWYSTPPPAVPNSIMSDYQQQQQWR